mgnify:CR=1
MYSPLYNTFHVPHDLMFYTQYTCFLDRIDLILVQFVDVRIKNIHPFHAVAMQVC